jgi:hypothetical protein
MKTILIRCVAGTLVAVAVVVLTTGAVVFAVAGFVNSLDLPPHD